MRFRLEKNNLPAAARGHATCEESDVRYNGVAFPVIGSRVRQTNRGPVEESYDRGMWPAVDWDTDNIIDFKIRHAVQKERERCAIITERAFDHMSPLAIYESYRGGDRPVTRLNTDASAKAIAESIRKG